MMGDEKTEYMRFDNDLESIITKPPRKKRPLFWLAFYITILEIGLFIANTYIGKK